MLVAVAEGEVVGNLDLRVHPDSPRRRHVGEIGVAVHDDWQGQGIGTALTEAALDLADNAARRALDEKFGFEIEGTHRRYALREGRYAHAYSMARSAAM